jgi:nucleoside 2-deoxyribosyltransferase
MKRIYLAGPGVFLPDPADYGARKKAICARYGFEGVFPLDAVLDQAGFTPFEQGNRISLANEELIRTTDLIIADMTPYQGISMDVGTAYEMGFARALGLPVLGYSNVALPFFGRAKASVRAERLALDPLGRPSAGGMALEDFAMTDNLMLHGAVHHSGYPVLAETVPNSELYTALEVFEKVVALVRP